MHRSGVRLPTPYTVQRLVWSAGEDDGHGNLTDTYADPVNVDVHGWAPPTEDVETNTNRDAVEHNLELFAPAGTVAHPRDRFIVAGITYDVVGNLQDYTTGPWQWQAGVRINLLNVEG